MGKRAARGKPKAPETGPAAPAAGEAPPLPPLARVVLPLVFVSGFCALAYQVGWQREFRGVFGASTAASAAVVAVFMGGLGLGAFLLGPRADRQRNPLRFYAVLEGLVALGAATTPWLLELARRAYFDLGGSAVLGAWGGSAVRLLLASLVLLPPTFLAGGTLGAAARAVETEGDRRRRATALLYGVNTLGAVAGALVTTFWALEALGTRGSLWAAALLNLAAAALAFALSRGRDAGADAAAADPGEAGEATAPPALVLAAALLVGFAFFLMEIVWYRMLGPILGGTVYTFGLILAIALFGIGVGGLAYARVFARAAVGLSALAATCLAEAACVALPFVLGDRIALLALALRPEAGATLLAYVTGWALVTAIVVLPASIVAGVQFPLLVALLGSGRLRLARHVGRAYFLNTIGGIVGALAGGFGLLPLLSAPGCWRAVALLLCGLGLLAVALDPRRARRGGLGLVAAAAIVVGALLAADGPTAGWRHSGIGAGRSGGPAPVGRNATEAWLRDVRRSIVWELEGVESSVAVQAVAGYSFLLNGKVDGNARNDAPTQVMGGLLGPLLQPGARRSLVIGLGTGSTAGWLAAVPGMERTDVVELEPAVTEVARLCAAVNRGALDNPKVALRIGDAREALMTTPERWDLVFSEPSNPYRAGIASLFTKEFYEAVDARLTPDGLFLQWLQAYEVDERTVSTILATMAAVFPAVEVWQVHHIDLVLVGSHRPLRHDLDSLRERIAQEPYASALRQAWRASDVNDVLARFVAGPALARGLRESGHEINTDDRNPVEFAFARTASQKGLFDVPQLRRLAAAAGADRLEIGADWERVARRRFDVYTLAGYAPPEDPAAPAEEQERRRAHAEYAAGELVAAARSFGARAPESAAETMLLAEGLSAAGDAAARAQLAALGRIQGTEAEAATASLAFRMGLLELARNALAASFVHYREDPWPSQVSMAQALALAIQIAQAQRESAPILAEAVSRPFAVAALEEPRRLVRMQLVSMEPLSDRCRDALFDMEPHVPWREDVLDFRSRCYAATRDPRARKAATDLAAFRAAPDYPVR